MSDECMYILRLSALELVSYILDNPECVDDVRYHALCLRRRQLTNLEVA